jgi:hypothetical protein
MLDSNLEQRARRTRWLPESLLLVLKSPRRHTEELRELLLRQADARSGFRRSRHLDFRDTRSLATTHLLDGRSEVGLKLLNFRSHLQSPIFNSPRNDAGKLLNFALE